MSGTIGYGSADPDAFTRLQSLLAAQGQSPAVQGFHPLVSTPGVAANPQPVPGAPAAPSRMVPMQGVVVDPNSLPHLAPRVIQTTPAPPPAPPAAPQPRLPFGVSLAPAQPAPNANFAPIPTTSGIPASLGGDYLLGRAGRDHLDEALGEDRHEARQFTDRSDESQGMDAYEQLRRLMYNQAQDRALRPPAPVQTPPLPSMFTPITDIPHPDDMRAAQIMAWGNGQSLPAAQQTLRANWDERVFNSEQVQSRAQMLAAAGMDPFAAMRLARAQAAAANPEVQNDYLDHYGPADQAALHNVFGQQVYHALASGNIDNANALLRAMGAFSPYQTRQLFVSHGPDGAPHLFSQEGQTVRRIDDPSAYFGNFDQTMQGDAAARATLSASEAAARRDMDVKRADAVAREQAALYRFLGQVSAARINHDGGAGAAGGMTPYQTTMAQDAAARNIVNAQALPQDDPTRDLIIRTNAERLRNGFGALPPAAGQQ